MIASVREYFKLENVFTWETWNWFNQLFFYLLCSVFFLKVVSGVEPHEMMPYYFKISTVALGTSAISVFFFRGPVRMFLALTHISVNAYLIPFSLTACGLGVGYSAMASVAYVIISVALCPRYAGIAPTVSGITFALFLVQYHRGDASSSDMLNITAAYIGLALLGYAWRMLVHKMFDIFNRAMGKSSIDDEELEAQRKEMAALKEDNQLLKDEMAVHIVEIEEIIGAKKQQPLK